MRSPKQHCALRHCLDMKFFLSDILVACILGTPFLAAVEPYGSVRTPERKVAFFITLPNIKIRQGSAKAIWATKVFLAFASSPQI